MTAITRAAAALLLCAATTRTVPAQEVQETVREDLTLLVEGRTEFSGHFPGVQVHWVRWDSAFYGSDLTPGDWIVGIDGRPLRPELHKSGKTIGAISEAQLWTAMGKTPGSPVSLLVRRGAEELSIEGEVRTGRSWRKGNKPLLSPTGPPLRDGDGFHPGWERWLTEMKGWMVGPLSDGQALRYDSQEAFKWLDAQRPRMAYLMKHYPGPFADATLARWKRARELARGEPVELTASDLAYRQLGEQRTGEVQKAAATAWQALLDARKADVVRAFPAIDPVRGDLAKVAGKWVALPRTATSRSLFKEGDSIYFAVGDRAKGVYFVDWGSRQLAILFKAMERYRRKVSPVLRDDYEFIGRIAAEPRMLVWGGVATTGLTVDVCAARVGDCVFVDLTGEDPDAPFAGEQGLTEVPGVTLAGDAAPDTVMRAFIGFVKLGDRKRWEAMFTTWQVRETGRETLCEPRQIYEGDLRRAWDMSRKLLLGDVFDIRVVGVGSTRVVFGGTGPSEEAALLGLDEESEAAAKPGDRVEECEVRVVHIVRFQGAYRPTTRRMWRREWNLQRRNGGPWRIVEVRSL